MQTIEQVVRTYIAKLTSNSDPAGVDMGMPLTDGLGLSSLDIVILITSACKGATIPMTTLTEKDINAIHTGNDLVQTLVAKQA